MLSAPVMSQFNAALSKEPSPALTVVGNEAERTSQRLQQPERGAEADNGKFSICLNVYSLSQGRISARAPSGGQSC